MLDLNIDKVGGDQEDYEIMPATVNQRSAPVISKDPSGGKVSEGEADIFDLALSIAGRAYSRRRFRRSSAIL